MKLHIQFLVIIGVLFTSSLYGECLNGNSPFKIGNSFYIKNSTTVYFPPYTTSTYYKTVIVKDTILNSKKYFFLTYYFGYTNKWWRLDTLSRNLFIFDPANSCPGYYREVLVDSLCANEGDSVKGCSLNYKCTSSGIINWFGQDVPSKVMSSSYSSPVFNSSGNHRYNDGFGFVSLYYSDYGGGGGGVTTISLLGCVINGVLYGDSNAISVHSISTNTPESFSLSQNYPNPFNPSTRINYELKISNYVSLKVFDFLGKEVASLVNEKQSAGSYAVDFNSAEYNLPSGIYFYTLNTGDFTETKKMVLVK